MLVRRLLLAIAIGAAAALSLLVAELAVRNYPSEDGVTLSDGQLLGGDFVAFYVGGRLFRENRPRLYDLDYQREFRLELFGPAASTPEAELPFFYPPLVAALVSPISRLPFQTAFLIWALLGLLVSFSSLIVLIRVSGASGVLPLPLLLLFGCGFVPFSMNTVLGGQASWMGLAMLSLTCAALLRDRDFLAGAAFSLSYYKPPLFFLLLCVLCVARGWRFLLGFALGACFLLGATILFVGPEGVLGFLSAASQLLHGQEVYPGLVAPRGQAMGLFAIGVTYSFSILTTLAFLSVPILAAFLVGYKLLKAQKRSDRVFGLLLSITASLAFSPYILKYDLALLLVPMVMGVAWYGRRTSSERIIPLLPFILFYFEFPFREISVGGVVLNLSSFLFLVLLGVLVWKGWRLAREGPPVDRPPTGRGSP